PNLGLFRVFKPRGHNADDAHRSPAELNLLSDDVRIRTEATFPQAVADDCDGLRISFVISGNERSPENGLEPEHGEEPGRHTGAWQAFRLRAIRSKVGLAGPVGGGAREEIGLPRPISKVLKRDVALADARRRILAFDID